MKKKFLILCTIAAIVLGSLFFIYKPEKNTAQVDVLSQIDNYQQRYFTIIKRNDLFVDSEKDSKQDRKDLDKLYKEVIKQIDSNNIYYKKYKQNEHEYENPKVELETTVQMDNYAIAHYKKVDSLLNEVYKEVKTKITPQEFEKLKTSEKKWLKEVEDYYEVFESQEFGTIGTVIYYGYQIDMREFRTLLLMLYL